MSCPCKAKEPREQVKKFELPDVAAIHFEPVILEVPWLVPLAEVRLPMASTPHTGCDPPRRLLTLYSRWLI